MNKGESDYLSTDKKYFLTKTYNLRGRVTDEIVLK